MPKSNAKGGNKHRRCKNNMTMVKQDLIIKEEGQEYAQVNKMLGSGRLEAFCFDGKTRLCHIRGKMLKKNWIIVGDVILIGLRDYQDSKADVIHKYSAEDSRKLKSQGEIPDNIAVNDKTNNDDNSNDNNVPFVFEDI